MLAVSAPPGSTVGADKGYDLVRFVEELRALDATAHVARRIATAPSTFGPRSSTAAVRALAS